MERKNIQQFTIQSKQLNKQKTDSDISGSILSSKLEAGLNRKPRFFIEERERHATKPPEILARVACITGGIGFILEFANALTSSSNSANQLFPFHQGAALGLEFFLLIMIWNKLKWAMLTYSLFCICSVLFFITGTVNFTVLICKSITILLISIYLSYPKYSYK